MAEIIVESTYKLEWTINIERLIFYTAFIAKYCIT